MVQQVEDPALSLQQLGSLLWRKFNPWPRNFHMPRQGQKKIFLSQRNSRMLSV